MRAVKEMVGALVCGWKGSHKWSRRKGSGMEQWVSCTGTASEVVMVGHTPAHSVCTRCGITRPIVARARKVVQ